NRIGCRPVPEQRFRERSDACSRNPVTSQGLPGKISDTRGVGLRGYRCRIIDNYGLSVPIFQVRKIAVSPRVDWHCCGSCRGVPVSVALFAEEPESLVPAVVKMRNHERPAQSAPELIVLGRCLVHAIAIVGPGVCVQLAVPEELESRAVQLVGTTSRGNIK